MPATTNGWPAALYPPHPAGSRRRPPGKLLEGNALSEKQALLREMEQQPGAYDETFLEVCLDDSRKEVRTAAALLLAACPPPALQGRLFARARALFPKTQKGTKARTAGKER
ncbi:MAG: hypothetical protein H6559_18910 [Lewinellaceae bacterium]|nr:hypothetical protein [Lewinellaceae bacterium]